MAENEKTYIAIDLKSFYASVECRERKLDCMTTNLVVADKSRTEKTICLAVSPSLKAYGIPGRARLFEVIQKIKEVNEERKAKLPEGVFHELSYNDNVIKKSPYVGVDYIVAKPRMALYMQYSARIYEIYLKYIASEDIHVYSIDEVFMDVTHYLKTYELTPKQLAKKIIKDIQQTTGITATAGIGTNLYLCKIAMDIMAKHIQADECFTENNYGIIDQLQIFGESEEDMQSNLRNMVCIRWEILPDVQLERKMNSIMKNFCTSYLV